MGREGPQRQRRRSSKSVLHVGVIFPEFLLRQGRVDVPEFPGPSACGHVGSR